MRRLRSKLVIAVMVMFGITFFMSCEKSNNDAKQHEKENSTTLLSNLNQFNSNFIPSDTADSKGFWSTLGEICKIAGADLIGAGTCVVATKELAAAAGVCTGGTGAAVVAGASAVIGGAGASYAASQIKASGYSSETGSSGVVLPPEYDYLSDVGIFHNSFLGEVYFGGMTQEDWIIQNYNENSPCVLEFTQNPEWITINNNVSSTFNNYSETGFDYLSVLIYFEGINYINSNIKNILDSYMQVYLMATSFEDIDDITNFYINEVAISSLPEIDKESLFCSFLVGANSPHFWLQTK